MTRIVAFVAATLAAAFLVSSRPGAAKADGFDLSPAMVARAHVQSSRSSDEPRTRQRLERHQRLRIGGWTTTAVGTILLVAGVGTSVGADCGSHPACHEDDELLRSIMGASLMVTGAGVASLVGLPLLLTARARKKRPHGRELSVAPTLGGATIRGRF